MRRPHLPAAARRFGAIGLLGLGLGACAHLPVAPRDFTPLRAALSEPPSVLQARAEQGDAVAQMSLSLAHRYGIGGAPIDDKLADALQRKATSQRGSTPITTYIAGLNGKPGRVSTIFVPRYDVSPATAAQNARCGAVIALGVEGESAREACGGPDSHAALRALWAGRAKE